MKVKTSIGAVCALILSVTGFSQNETPAKKPPKEPAVAAKDFPAPGPDDPPLLNTHDVIEAFLSNGHWQHRLPFIYKADELKSKIEAYYDKWPDSVPTTKFRMKLFQMELDPKYQGPFWVFQIMKDDSDKTGYPIIVRKEGGNLKVDWELYSEFYDQHFVKFFQGKIKAPRALRLVAERVEVYKGADAPAFKNLNEYTCYRVFPPYGGFDKFTQYAFVKKDSEIGRELAKTLGKKSEALAMILTIDFKDFSHGTRHPVITKVNREGWLREFEEK